MRPSALLLPASLLLASSALAQNQPYPPPEAPISTVQVSAPIKPVIVMTDEADLIKGHYKMSNGWRLNVETGTHHIDAAIDKQKPMRLVAVAPYKFVSRDGNVTMDFNLGAWGDEMVMSYVPGPRLARIYLSSSPALAQR